MSPAAEPRTYRTAGTVRAASATTVGAMAFLAFALVSSRGQTIGFVFTAILALAAWRMWIGGIHIEKDGIRVAGLFMSKRVLWAEIDHFAVLPLGQYPYVGHVVLRDGHQIPCIALAAAGRPATERRRLQVQAPVDQLNEILARHQPHRFG